MRVHLIEPTVTRKKQSLNDRLNLFTLHGLFLVCQVSLLDLKALLALPFDPLDPSYHIWDLAGKFQVMLFSTVSHDQHVAVLLIMDACRLNI